MGRYKGTFSVAANYEPLVGGPFDARQLVETKSDLTNPRTWRSHSGEIWVYIGMMVVVSSDINANNNGLYILKDNPYTDEANWVKYATEADIADLQQQIDDIEVGSGGSLDVNVETEADLPEVGDQNTTYYVKDNSSIQRWDEETQSYQSYGGSGEIPELDVNLIYGGDSNGND